MKSFLPVGNGGIALCFGAIFLDTGGNFGQASRTLILNKPETLMLKPTQAVKPAVDRVVAKVIDGEAIIMDIQSGVYHSLDAVGAFIWESIERVLPLEDIAKSVTAHFDVSIEAARQDLMNLAKRLLEEGIVLAADPNSASSLDAPGAPGSGRSIYVAPVLQTYHDMGDLLALDPPAPNASDLRWEE